MSLYLALNNALSGLNVNKQALALLSQNIANANTPGYTRKIVELSNNIIAGTGYGAKVEDIARKVDEYLSRAIQQQGSAVGKSEVLSDYAERLQILLGKPGGSSTLTAALSSFFGNLQQLAETPDLGSLKLTSVNSGVTLARQVSDLVTNLHDLRFEADKDIKIAINSVNQTIEKLQSVNGALAYAYNSGNPSPDLMDKRDALLRDLGQYMDISYYNDEIGEAHVATAGGLPLLDNARYKIVYSGLSSRESFSQNATMPPVYIYRVDENGNAIGDPQTLVTSGPPSQVTTSLISGKVRALLDLRDTKIPQIVDQLDVLAAAVRDQVNAVHNSGSSYPGASSYTGTRIVNAEDTSEWTGKVRIALLDSAGQAVRSPWLDETSGLRPLTIDFSKLQSEFGTGQPKVQTIIDEINGYYAQPQNKASLGPLNNIRLASDSEEIPGSPAQFSFDFDLENISANNTDFFVTNVQVLNDASVDISSTTSTIPTIELDSSNTYTSTNNSGVVTVKTAASHGLQNGDWVFLETPLSGVGGISNTALGGYFRVGNVTNTTFEISTTEAATSGTTSSEANLTGNPKYSTSIAGEYGRTRTDGKITADLTGDAGSEYYIINVSVGTTQPDGTITSGIVQYKILNGDTNILNKRFSAQDASGSANFTLSTRNSPMLQAQLVDASGNELPKLNGAYLPDDSGYLKIVAMDSGNVVAIDSLDSQQLGFPNNSPPVEGTNRGFSYYFELNNFFAHNINTATGDTVAGSAMALRVEDRIARTPNLISTGQLQRSVQPADPAAPPLYTYERYAGDNSIAQQMAGLTTARILFGAAGGLGDITTDFSGYSGQILGFIAADAAGSKQILDNSKLVLDGFQQRMTSLTGVNLDEELANTIIYQNAYSASARIISVTDKLFDVLLNSVQ